MASGGASLLLTSSLGLGLGLGSLVGCSGRDDHLCVDAEESELARWNRSTIDKAGTEERTNKEVQHGLVTMLICYLTSRSCGGARPPLQHGVRDFLAFRGTFTAPAGGRRIFRRTFTNHAVEFYRINNSFCTCSRDEPASVHCTTPRMYSSISSRLPRNPGITIGCTRPRRSPANAARRRVACTISAWLHATEKLSDGPPYQRPCNDLSTTLVR